MPDIRPDYLDVGYPAKPEKEYDIMNFIVFQDTFSRRDNSYDPALSIDLTHSIFVEETSDQDDLQALEVPTPPQGLSSPPWVGVFR